MLTFLNDTYIIGKVPVADLAARHGTPLYAYDEATILSRTRSLKENIGVYPDTKFLYAIKANYNPEILKLIFGQGFGADAVSIEEAKLALYCGVSPSDIMYTESNIGDSEMEEVHRLGILLNIGSLSRLEKWGRKYPGSEVCIRFNPNIGDGSHKTNITAGPDVKFGIQHEYASQALEISDRYGLRIIGVHEHIGSGWLDYRQALLAMDIIFEVARKIRGLKFIDLGGGFGVPYRPDHGRLDMVSLGKEYAVRFNRFSEEYFRLEHAKPGSALQLRFEPGRYVVAESGHLLARVTTLKKSTNGRVFAGIDTGMNHLVRVAMYGSYHPIINITNPNGRIHRYDICGYVCESSDSFAIDREIPEIREGDILSIEMTGAYGMSMASNYQFRPLPAEIMVGAGGVKIIRKRQDFDDMVKMLTVG